MDKALVATAEFSKAPEPNSELTARAEEPADLSPLLETEIDPITEPVAPSTPEVAAKPSAEEVEQKSEDFGKLFDEMLTGDSKPAETPLTEAAPTFADEKAAPEPPQSKNQKQWRLPWEDKQGSPQDLVSPEPSAPAAAEPQAATGSLAPADSITVDPSNRRQLAWLLGAKLSLALLANPTSTTAEQRLVWETETKQLAEILSLSAPPLSTTNIPEENISLLLRTAEELGYQLSKAAQPEQAALLELAVKSNVLLALNESRRAFAPVIAEALRSAADRTTLAADIWEPQLERLSQADSNDSIAQAVLDLHRLIDQSLRNSSP